MFVDPAQTEAGPVIGPGCAGTVLTVTGSVCAAEEPQILFAVTCIVPPALPAVAMIVLVVDVPLQPAGNVHV